jgi:hypothetical protein
VAFLGSPCTALTLQVMEHEDELVPGNAGKGGAGKLDTSSRRAALLEGAMTSTICHPHIVQVCWAEGEGLQN